MYREILIFTVSNYKYSTTVVKLGSVQASKVEYNTNTIHTRAFINLCTK